MIIVDTFVRHNKLWFKKNSVVRRGLRGGGGGGHSDEGQHFVWFGMVPASQATFFSVILGQSKCFLATDRYWVTLFQLYWDRANAFSLQTGTG